MLTGRLRLNSTTMTSGGLSRFVIAGMFALATSGCGVKGDLYLPDTAAESERPAASSPDAANPESEQDKNGSARKGSGPDASPPGSVTDDSETAPQ